MIDPQANPKSYLRLMTLAALLGIVSAVVTFAFIALVNQGIDLIWERASRSISSFESRVYVRFSLFICLFEIRMIGDFHLFMCPFSRGKTRNILA
jgi:hypothetical protein